MLKFTVLFILWNPQNFLVLLQQKKPLCFLFDIIWQSFNTQWTGRFLRLHDQLYCLCICVGIQQAWNRSKMHKNLMGIFWNTLRDSRSCNSEEHRFLRVSPCRLVAIFSFFTLKIEVENFFLQTAVNTYKITRHRSRN